VTEGGRFQGTAELGIGEVAQRTGQTVVTLRHWEAMGLLPPPPRTGGKRRYAEEVMSRIAMIDLLRRAGFSLDEARELLAARPSGEPPGGAWQTLMVRKQAELDEHLAVVHAARKLLAHLADCKCHSFDECLAKVGYRCHEGGTGARHRRGDRSAGDAR
jgi:MerR family transcriptional regulator, redox-sensitive transcriptional activator SoxR